MLEVLVPPALLAVGVYVLTAPRPDSVRQAAERRTRQEDRRRPRARNDNLLLWLSGIALPAPMLPVVQVVSAGLGGMFAFAVTHNVVIAGEFAYVTWFTPITLLKTLAVRRWNKADDSAFTVCNVLRFKLALSGHPVEAVRSALEDTDEPLRGWLSEAIGLEAAGKPFEESLYDLGVRLRHSEMSLLAEILKADRREARAHALLPGLLDAWTERIRGAQQRRAKLASAQTLSNLMIWAPICLFFVLNAFTGVGATFQGSFLGQITGDVGFTILVAAATIARTTLDKERGLPS